jgi:hypothetical protein
MGGDDTPNDAVVDTVVTNILGLVEAGEMDDDDEAFSVDGGDGYRNGSGTGTGASDAVSRLQLDLSTRGLVDEVVARLDVERVATPRSSPHSSHREASASTSPGHGSDGGSVGDGGGASVLFHRTPRGSVVADAGRSLSARASPSAATPVHAMEVSTPFIEERIVMSQSLRNIERLLQRIESVLSPSPSISRAKQSAGTPVLVASEEAAARFPRAELFGASTTATAAGGLSLAATTADAGPDCSPAGALGLRLYELQLAGDASCDVHFEAPQCCHARALSGGDAARGAATRRHGQSSAAVVVESVPAHSVVILSACPRLHREFLAAQPSGAPVRLPAPANSMVLRMWLQILYLGTLNVETTPTVLRLPTAGTGGHGGGEQGEAGAATTSRGAVVMAESLVLLKLVQLCVLALRFDSPHVVRSCQRVLANHVNPRSVALVVTWLKQQDKGGGGGDDDGGGEDPFQVPLEARAWLVETLRHVADVVGQQQQGAFAKHLTVREALGLLPRFVDVVTNASPKPLESELQHTCASVAQSLAESLRLQPGALAAALEDDADSHLADTHGEDVADNEGLALVALAMLVFGESATELLRKLGVGVPGPAALRALQWFWCAAPPGAASNGVLGGAGGEAAASSAPISAPLLRRAVGHRLALWLHTNTSRSDSVAPPSSAAATAVARGLVNTIAATGGASGGGADLLSQAMRDLSSAGSDQVPVALRCALALLAKASELPAQDEDVAAVQASRAAAALLVAAGFSTSSSTTASAHRTAPGRKRLVVVGGFSGRRLDVVESLDPVTGQWEALAPLSSLRTGACAAAVAVGGDRAGAVVVCGGYAGGELDLDSCEALVMGGCGASTSSSAWTPLPRMSQRRRGCAGAAWRGRVVVFGGCTDGGRAVADCELYDPASGRWLPLPPMRHARSACCAVAARLRLGGSGRQRSEPEDCVVVLGGVKAAGEFVAAVEVLVMGRSGDSPEWRGLGDMPDPRSHCAAVAVPSDGSAADDDLADRVLVLGGSSARVQFMRDVVLFDPAAVSEQEEQPLPWPQRRVQAKATVGESAASAVARWRTVTPLRCPRAGCAAAVVDGRVWVCGGWPKHGFSLKSVEVAKLEALLLAPAAAVVADSPFEEVEVCGDGSCWSFAPPMAVARGGCAVAVAEL